MDTLACLKSLIAFPTVSNTSNAEVSAFVEDALRSLNFETERIEYRDSDGVLKVNIVGRRGRGPGGMAWFGHTDVVPVTDWIRDHSPFEATEDDGKLFGRGTCDMKGPVACMLSAAAQFADTKLPQPLYIVCTADEEVGSTGAFKVAEQSQFYRDMVATDIRSIIGEPTMLDVVYAHKGAYGFQAVSHGRAAHSSTTLGVNANLAMIPFLSEMKTIYEETQADTRWHNPEFDPPTLSWNIGINDHTHAVNITPPQSVCTVFFRPMPGMDYDELITRAQSAAERCGVQLDVKHRCQPVYTAPDSEFVRQTLQLADRSAAITVSYGTDGVAFGELSQKLVIGPGDIAQAHTNNEFISLQQLELGTELYAKFVEAWCCASG